MISNILKLVLSILIIILNIYKLIYVQYNLYFVLQTLLLAPQMYLGIVFPILIVNVLYTGISLLLVSAVTYIVLLFADIAFNSYNNIMEIKAKNIAY